MTRSGRRWLTPVRFADRRTSVPRRPRVPVHDQGRLPQPDRYGSGAGYREHESNCSTADAPGCGTLAPFPLGQWSLPVGRLRRAAIEPAIYISRCSTILTFARRQRPLPDLGVPRRWAVPRSPTGEFGSSSPQRNRFNRRLASLKPRGLTTAKARGRHCRGQYQGPATERGMSLRRNQYWTPKNRSPFRTAQNAISDWRSYEQHHFRIRRDRRFYSAKQGQARR